MTHNAMDSAIVVESTDEDELIDIESDDVINDITIDTDVIITNNLKGRNELSQNKVRDETNHISGNKRKSHYDNTNFPFKRTKTDKFMKQLKADDSTQENDLTKWWKSASEFRRPEALENEEDKNTVEMSTELDPILKQPDVLNHPSSLEGVETTDTEIYYDESGEVFCPPSREQILPLDVISENERELFPKFFSGRTRYCPGKYLTIRNAILKLWNESKPSHVNKVMLRPVLKKGCGNVNNIGQIHRYLESIGAINFESDLVWWKKQKKQQKSKTQIEPTNTHRHTALDTDYKLKRALEQRMSGRSRKRPAPFVPDLKSDNLIGGYTIDHANNNQIVIPQPNDNEAKKESQTKSAAKKYNLIECKEYGDEKECPYDVTIHASALIVVDIHSHLLTDEVMGLLGGYVTHGDDGKVKIQIMCAQPCKSSSSARHCEMDSVSQTIASEQIATRGLSVIGWYHSHPTFPPQPSVTDIKTQISQQSMFSAHGSVFLGLIISSHHKHKIKSEVNIIHIEAGSGPGTEEIPYRIPFTIDEALPDGGGRDLFISLLSELIANVANESRNRIAQLFDPMLEGSSITHLDKIMKSLSSFIASQSTSSVTSQYDIRELLELPTTQNSQQQNSPNDAAIPVITSELTDCDAEQSSSIYDDTNPYAISSNFSLFSENSFCDYDVISHCDIISQCDDVTNTKNDCTFEPDTTEKNWNNVLGKVKSMLSAANSNILGKIT